MGNIGTIGKIGIVAVATLAIATGFGRAAVPASVDGVQLAREAEPGDDRGGNGETEPGDDKGGHGGDDA